MIVVNWSIQHKRGTAADWTTTNPELKEGQIGIESDTYSEVAGIRYYRMKLGVGDLWNDTKYLGMLSSLSFASITGNARDNADLNNELSIHDQVLIALANAVGTKAEKVSGKESGGTITVGSYGGSGVNNDVRVGPTVWYIVGSGSFETLIDSYFLDFVPCTAGNIRYVGFFGKTDGTIEAVEGTEGIEATYPENPGTAPIGYIQITDAGVNGAAIDLSGFVEKTSAATSADASAGTSATKWLNPAATGPKDGPNGYVGLTSQKINFWNNAKSFLSWLVNANTGARTYTFMDRDGIVADKQYVDAAEVSAKAYADGLVVGLWDDRGNYNASVNTFPASGGSGLAGAILKGDVWTVSVAGTLGGVAVAAGDTVRALSDTPGQTAGNWALGENNFGYTPENAVNKDASGGYAGLTLFKINFKNAANTITSFFTNANTVARTYTFQNRDGTIADNTDLALKADVSVTKRILVKDVTDATSVTGTTNNTLSYATAAIPGGTIVVGNFLEFISRVRKTGGNAGYTVRHYINTSASLSGATLISTQSQAGSGAGETTVIKFMAVKSASVTECTSASTNSVMSAVVTNNGVTNANIDWTVDQYFITAVQLVNGSDAGVSSCFTLTRT